MYILQLLNRDKDKDFLPYRPYSSVEIGTTALENYWIGCKL